MIHIETVQYGDPNQMTFLPHHMLLEGGPIVFEDKQQAMQLPLAAALFDMEGVKQVKIGTDFIQISKHEEVDWQGLQKDCTELIEAHLTPLLAKDNGTSDCSEPHLLADVAILTGFLLS